MSIIHYLLSLSAFVITLYFSQKFVAVEYSVTTLEASYIQSVKPQSAKQKIVLDLILKSVKNVSHALSSVQLGITLTTIISGALAPQVIGTPLLLLAHLCKVPVVGAGVVVINVISIFLATSISMVFGELVPKNIAIAHPLHSAEKTIVVLQLFSMVFALLVNLFDSLALRIVKMLGFSPRNEEYNARSSEEIAVLVNSALSDGNSDDSVSKLVHRALQFGDRTAEELMTPRSKVRTIDAHATINDLIELSVTTGFSRFPVVKGDFDDAVGLVDIKQIFSSTRSDYSKLSVQELCCPFTQIIGSLSADQVMDTLRVSESRMALVVDEYGGNAGIITFEDLIEEIVGEVRDEYDTENARITQVGDSYHLSGLLRLDEVFDEISFSPCHGDYETIGGAVIAILGEIPSVGDKVIIPDQRTVDGMNPDKTYYPCLAEVIAIEGLRIDKIALTPLIDLPELSKITDNKELRLFAYSRTLSPHDSYHNSKEHA